MDLWIRTQDRDDLLKVSRIKINYPISNAIQGITENNMVITLGIYEEEKRALEIIDEIQKLLRPRIMMKYNDDFTMSVSDIEPQPATYVYEMPEQ